MVVLFLPLI
jgi:hypothetical protein